MVLSDRTIKQLVAEGALKIEPFHETLKEKGIISWGLGSCGYDLRLARRFKIFTNVHGAVVDPKAMDPMAFVDVEGDTCLIPPCSFVLAEAEEYIAMPPDVMGLVTTKSTYARAGVCAPSTVVEPGWRGKLTLEIANHTPLPARVYAGEGAVQLLLFQIDKRVDVSYADRGGKYQDQDGLTLPFVREDPL